MRGARVHLAGHPCRVPGQGHVACISPSTLNFRLYIFAFWAGAVYHVSITCLVRCNS